MGEKLSLCFGACRIGMYMLYKWICCIPNKKPTPELNIVCLGLTNSGKSTMLAALNKESLLTQPTIGFNIKAVHMKDCILNVKEIGGSDKVRPYWSRYFDSSDGVIFVVNGSAPDLSLEARELRSALEHPSLDSLPVLILATQGPHEQTHESQKGDAYRLARTVDQLADDLHVGELFQNSELQDQCIIQTCSSPLDTDAISQGLTRLSLLLLTNIHTASSVHQT